MHNKSTANSIILALFTIEIGRIETVLIGITVVRGIADIVVEVAHG